MKNKSPYIISIRSILVILCCIAPLRKDTLLAYEPTHADAVLPMAKWKERPHNVQFGYGISVYSEDYTYFAKKPLSHFSLDYAFDIRWKPVRTNFFLTGSVAYDGDLWNDRKKHPALDRFHLSAGLGFRIRFAQILDFSFDYSPGFFYEEILRYYPRKTFEMGARRGGKAMAYGYRGLCSVRLMGEVKNIRFGIGFEYTHGYWPNWQDIFISVGIGYRF